MKTRAFPTRVGARTCTVDHRIANDLTAVFHLRYHSKRLEIHVTTLHSDELRDSSYIGVNYQIRRDHHFQGTLSDSLSWSDDWLSDLRGQTNTAG